jgi:hypothetical protein
MRSVSRSKPNRTVELGASSVAMTHSGVPITKNPQQFTLANIHLIAGEVLLRCSVRYDASCKGYNELYRRC